MTQRRDALCPAKLPFCGSRPGRRCSGWRVSSYPRRRYRGRPRYGSEPPARPAPWRPRRLAQVKPQT